VDYRRFSSAAQAVRYAIEYLPSNRLPGVTLEVCEARYGHQAIRRLYQGIDQ
jgi:hypothetical protein